MTQWTPLLHKGHGRWAQEDPGLGTKDGMASSPPGWAACLGDERCGDVVHDIWLHSVGMWPAAQCQAASAAALVSTCQTPVVAVDVVVER